MTPMTKAERDERMRQRERQRTHVAVIRAALFNTGAFAADAHTKSALEILSDDRVAAKFLEELAGDIKPYGYPNTLAGRIEAFELGAARLIELLRKIEDARP